MPRIPIEYKQKIFQMYFEGRKSESKIAEEERKELSSISYILRSELIKIGEPGNIFKVQDNRSREILDKYRRFYGERWNPNS